MDAREKKRLYLRGTIKLLVGTGFVFLAIPFLKSLPWPRDTLPAGSIVVAAADLAPGVPRRVDFHEQTVWVTRVDDGVRARLQALSPALWSPGAPERLDVPYLVVSGLDADHAPVAFRAAAGAWPGGFVSADGGAWDVAGRALKPGPAAPDAPPLPPQGLAPMPFQRHGDDVLLVPPPDTPPEPTP